MFFSTEAIVLKRTKLSDNDMILTLFTKKAGKINAIASGARHPKSRFAAGAHPFVVGRYNVSSGNSLSKVTSIDVHESFYHIREDLDKLAYGAWFLELADLAVAESMLNNKLFIDLIETIHVLLDDEINPNQLKVAYELKLLDSIGFRPVLNECINCGATGDRKWQFSVSDGGLVCENCTGDFETLYRMGKTLPKIMMYFLIKDMKIISKTKIHDSYIKKLDIILNAYLRHHLDRNNFKSLDFLNSIRTL